MPEPMSAPAEAATPAEPDAQLLEPEDSRDFEARWNAVQQRFVDGPRRSVAEADDLVAAVVQRLSALFEADRMLLERQWSEGRQASTEDLRIALQRYRSFFHRLLSV